MKRTYKIFTLIALISMMLLGGCAANQATQQPQPAPVAADADTQVAQTTGKPLFWTATGSAGTVYLLGSIHVADQSFYPLAAPIETAFEKSEALVVEADITAGADASSAMLANAMYKDGTTVKDHLPDSTYVKLQQALKAKGMDMLLAQPLKAWVLAMTMQMMDARAAGLDAASGIDLHFLTKANQTNKPIVELEGINYQVNLFNSFDDQVQAEFLEQQLSSDTDLKQKMQELIVAWKAGDDKALDELINEDATGDSDVLTEKLLYQRNREMTEKIAPWLSQEKTMFVVVGAGHLVGDKGVVELLRELGYTITR